MFINSFTKQEYSSLFNFPKNKSLYAKCHKSLWKYSFNANIEKYYKRGGIKDYSLMNISNIKLIEE